MCIRRNTNRVQAVRLPSRTPKVLPIAYSAAYTSGRPILNADGLRRLLLLRAGLEYEVGEDNGIADLCVESSE